MQKREEMPKDIIEEQSINERNIEILKQNFPNAIETDEGGKIIVNAQKLQMALDPSKVKVEEDGYELRWVGKKEAYHTAFTKNRKILKPLKDDSKEWDTTGNILIKGDNLDALRILKHSYFEQIKMIYIDPPYNTKSDEFVYNDDFTATQEETLEALGYSKESRDYVKNIYGAKTHSGWLSFMYPRLLLARDLLRDDGVIFISIDDNEVAQLKILCDEIFSESNYVGQITVQSNPRGSQSSNFFATVDEYLLCYAKNIQGLSIRGYKKNEDDSDYNFIDEKTNKKYRLLGLRQRGGAWKREDRPKMFYPIYVNPDNGEVSLTQDNTYSKESLPKRPTGEESRWTWGVETFEKEKHNLVGKKVNRDGENDFWDIFRKDFLENENGILKSSKPKTIWNDIEINYQNGRNDILNILGNSEIFNFPKPVFLLEKIIDMFEMKNEIILDFFAGSGTTAHAVMDLNAKDGSSRKFICVQWAEETSAKSEARKAGYGTIFDITRARIDKAGNKIAENENLISRNIDIGFRVFEVTDDEKQAIYSKKLSEITQSNLTELANTPKSEEPETILYNLLTAEKLSLDTKIDELEKGVFYGAKNVGIVLGAFDIGRLRAILKEHGEIEYISVYSPLIEDDNFNLMLHSLLEQDEYKKYKLRIRG